MSPYFLFYESVSSCLLFDVFNTFRFMSSLFVIQMCPSRVKQTVNQCTYDSLGIRKNDVAIKFCIAICVFVTNEINANSNNGSTSSNKNLDIKRRNDLVDETFLEQKDVLLEMLETKLKEVRDKKKKKSDKGESSNNCVLESNKCELPKNVDMRLKGNGISAIGEADVQLRYGKSGKGTLNLDATGISNVGKAQLDLGVGDGAVHIPGLENLFVGHMSAKNYYNETANNDEYKMKNVVIYKMETRRNNTEEPLKNATGEVSVKNEVNDANATLIPKETEVKINATVIEISTISAVTKSNNILDSTNHKDVSVVPNAAQNNLTNSNVTAK